MYLIISKYINYKWMQVFMEDYKITIIFRLSNFI